MNIFFEVGVQYSRNDIYNILQVPEEIRRGNWETGYNKYNEDWFIFSNIGVPGRTGHDYDNYWLGDEFVWHGKTGSKISHDSIQSMLNPNGNIYLFTRDSNRSPFTFEGNVRVKSYKDTVPVTIVWELIDINERSIERLPEEISNAHLFMEGLKKKIYVNRYERNPHARRLCIEHHGLTCIVCGFNFEKFYGKLGSNYIHVHHVIPLSEIKEEYEIDPINDLKPLCANCHAMIHRFSTPLTIDELRRTLRGDDDF